MNSRLQHKFGPGETASLINLLFSEIGYSRTQILAGDDVSVTETSLKRLWQFVEELYTERPVQYILGYAWFYDLKIDVDESVLIPRPETEELVDYIIRHCPFRRPLILDIGTGSGCIAVSLSVSIPDAEVYATDISAEALETARRNNLRNKGTVHFLRDDILHPSPDIQLPQVDILVSNPPYVRLSEKKAMKKNVLDYEPHEALFVSDDDALIFYRAIRDFSYTRLKSGGVVYLEINENLGPETAGLFKAPDFEQTLLIKDMHGRDRFIQTKKI